MLKIRGSKMASDKVDKSTEVASSYIKGEKIKKMLKAISFEDSKGGIVVSLNKAIINLDDVYYRIDLLNRDQTSKAYELVCKEGISSLKLVKIK